MTLDEYEIKLTEAYIAKDQTALNDLKIRAMIKLHTIGDRSMWERWEQHRLLESLIQDWPEPLLRNDLTDKVLSGISGAEVNPFINPLMKPASSSETKIDHAEFKTSSYSPASDNSEFESGLNLNNKALQKPQPRITKGARFKSALSKKSALSRKSRVTKLDSFVIVPPDQPRNYNRALSRVGFMMAVFVAGLSLGLAINQAVNTYFYGSSMVAEQVLLDSKFDANMNHNGIDLTKALKDAGRASNVMFDQALNPINNNQQTSKSGTQSPQMTDHPQKRGILTLPAKPETEMEKSLKQSIDEFWRPSVAPPGSDSSKHHQLPVVMN